VLAAAALQGCVTTAQRIDALHCTRLYPALDCGDLYCTILYHLVLLQVALKALSLKGIKDWKQLELFQREAVVLQVRVPSQPKTTGCSQGCCHWHTPLWQMPLSMCNVCVPGLGLDCFACDCIHWPCFQHQSP
jgi:hypothetical protein